MNRNYKKKSNDGKLPAGFYIGIVFALIGISLIIPVILPVILPIIIIGAVFIVSIKRGKNISMKSFNSESIINIKKDTGEVEDFDATDYKNQTDSQKRLETLKGLYENGFMERDEYEATKKRYM